MMKKMMIAVLLLSIVSSLNAQKRKSEKVKNVKMFFAATNPLSENIKSYAYYLNTDFKETEKLNFNESLAGHFMNLKGYRADFDSPDIIITANINDLNQGLAKYTQIEDVYSIQIPYTLQLSYTITNKEGNQLYAENFNIESNCEIPSATPLTTLDAAKNIVSQNHDKIATICQEKSFANALTKLRKSLAQYSNHAKLFNIEFYTFKTDKKFDGSEWQKNAEIALAVVEKANAGADLQTLKSEMQPAVDFWTNIINTKNIENKEQKKEVAAALYNTLSAYYITYQIDLADEFKNKYKDLKIGSLKGEFSELSLEVSTLKKHFGPNIQFAKLYTKNFKNTLVFLNPQRYRGSYTDKKGNKKECVFNFSEPYNYNPAQQSLSISLIPLDVYSEKNGNLSSKDIVSFKPGDIQSYEILGDKYFSMEVSDPTALTLGSTKNFAKLVANGKLKLYELHFIYLEEGQSAPTDKKLAAINARQHFNYLLPNEKGGLTVVFNTLRLDEKIKDCSEIDQRFRDGAYGNKAFSIPTSKVKLKIARQVSNLDNNQIYELVRDYNNCVAK